MTATLPVAVTIALCLMLAVPGAGRGEEAPKIEAVASFSILADMVRQVGGERVRITSLVGPNGDAHVYRPTASDARMVAQADIVFINGLGFEGWLARLVKVSGGQAQIVEASRGASLIEAAPGENDGHDEAADHPGSDVDPHAWNDIGNALIYVANIERGLCDVDGQGCDLYRRNAADYADELRALDEEVRAAMARLPGMRRTLIMPHTALGYFARRYGLTILAPEGLSTEGEASARGVATLIEEIRRAGASALFAENIKNRRLIEQIARETGASIGGALYADALSEPGGPAPTYIEMVRHNARTIIEGASKN